MSRLCPSIHFKHRWIMVDGEPTCVWCGQIKDIDRRDRGKPKPNNSRKNCKERKRKARIKHKIRKRLKRQHKRIQKRNKKGRAYK